VRRATGDGPERLAFAGRIARQAGERILAHYGQTGHATKAGGSPVTAADLESNAYLVAAIREACPEEPVLAEESADSTARLGAERLWLVDPLDGTKEFLARNGEFSVMIGLVTDGVPVLGVVYLPARRLLYGAGPGTGAWVESDAGVRRALRCVPADPRSLRMVGSRSHPDALLERMQRALDVHDVRPSGSVGIKCALIAEGERDVYIHPVRYLKEWDTCAPEALLREAGGTVTDCLGHPLRYNQVEPAQEHGIVACASDVHAKVVERIRPLYEEALRSRAAGAD
jgi:3'(2'), 5'-bisphosphate nucleotidase